MAIFKRFEVWLLLFMIGAALWFVFQPPKEDVEEEIVEAPKKVEPAKAVENPKAAPNPKSVAEVKPEPGKREPGKPKKSVAAPPKKSVPVSTDRFEIREANLVSEGGGSVVEISLLGRNEKPLNLEEPNVRLVAENGDQFERFFLPFDPAPVLDGEESVADLKYWVEGDLKAEKLWLEIDGERVAVDLKKQ